MAEIKVDELVGEVAKVLKDALYISVGLGVLAVQKLQEQRRELTRRFEEQFDTGRDQMASFRSHVEQQLKSLEGRLDTVEERVDSALDQLQAKLPDQAGELLGQTRQAVKQAREQVLDRMGRPKQPAA